MKHGATGEQVEAVQSVIESHGYRIHEISGDERVVIAAIGVGDVSACIEVLTTMDGVDKAVPISSPYKMCSREAHPHDTVIRIDGTDIGGSHFITMAGPCAAESGEQVDRCAEFLSVLGVQVLRGGAFKPRTTRHTFQGHGEEALRWMRAAADRYSMSVITEVMEPGKVEVVAEYADILQVGARNVQNFPLLTALGDLRKPVMLKRGEATSVETWLCSADYIVSGGNPNVILCERGIQAAPNIKGRRRNTLDIAVVPELRELTHLPIVLDFAHGMGNRRYIPQIAAACVAANADGIMVEVHPDPAHALSDGFQSLNFPEFSGMMRMLEPYLELWRQLRASKLEMAACA